MISLFQIYLTRTGSRAHHRNRRAREPESTVVVETGANEERKVISDLKPYSHYALAVTVFNSKGEGPPSETLSFKTHEGGENEKEWEKLWVEEGCGRQMVGGDRQSGWKDLIRDRERQRWSKMGGSEGGRDGGLQRRKWHWDPETGNEWKESEIEA